MDLRERVLDAGRHAGLAGIGVCSAAPFSEVAASLADAVSSGRSAGMRFTFADPMRSTDPSSSFPWARSLVVGAHSYLPAAGTPGEGSPGTARIARFATEDHYRLLRAALDAVARIITDAGHRADVLVDDNRLVDRAAAVRAGVAWWGKNTMALVPGYGPWVLLGSVVTDAVLPEDAPMVRGCGTCDACLPACPTGALVSPGILDARLCLAYWLQAPGSIPRELRVAVGDRLYGCDDCLEACPPGGRLVLRSTRSEGRVGALEILRDSDSALIGRYQRFYIPRNEAAYLRRNALVVTGNSGDRSLVPVVSGYAGHRDPMLREHAVWALGRLGGAVARAVLAEACHDPVMAVASEAALSLAEAA